MLGELSQNSLRRGTCSSHSVQGRVQVPWLLLQRRFPRDRRQKLEVLCQLHVRCRKEHMGTQESPLCGDFCLAKPLEGRKPLLFFPLVLKARSVGGIDRRRFMPCELPV